MHIKYAMTKGIIVPVSSHPIVTYGIVANDESGNKVDSFDDVSVNKVYTQSILDILNSCEVELCHFRDVIIDELNR